MDCKFFLVLKSLISNFNQRTDGKKLKLKAQKKPAVAAGLIS